MTELWDLRDRREKKPRLALSLSRIVEAAIEIADTEGIEAVSMQRVAADLGFTKMSLYRHVRNKSDLLNIMIDTAVGEPPDVREMDGGWRPRMREVVRRLTEVWQRHPWLPTVTVGARAMGPREAGWTESALAALSGTGLTGDERLAAAFIIFGHVRNTQSIAGAGTQAWWDGELSERIRGRAGSFPELGRALNGPTTALDDNARTFGLDRILDGLAVLIEERS